MKKYNIEWSKATEKEKEEWRKLVNPNKEPFGHFTGRCKRCQSSKLWDDVSAYGCEDCGWCSFDALTH